MNTTKNSKTLLKNLLHKLHPSRKVKVLLSIAGGFFALFFAMFATQAQHNPNEVEEKSVPVSTVSMSPRQIQPELHLYGRLETPNTVTLRSAVTAYVNSVNVSEGANVEKGDLLVVLDDSDASLSVMQFEADLNDATASLSRVMLQQKSERSIFDHQKKLFALTKDKLSRQHKLYEDKLVAKQHLDETEREFSLQAINLEQQKLKIANHSHDLTTAKARVQRAQAALEQAKLTLERTVIRSPFTGRVTSVMASVGDRLSTGTAVIEVFDRESMQIRVALPAEHSSHFNNPDAISAGIKLDDKDVAISLIDVAAKVAKGRAGLDGLFKVPSDFEHAELGRMMPVRITLPAVGNTLAIPVQSLYGNKRIYRVADNRLQGIEVTRVGERLSENGGYEVLVSSPDLVSSEEIVVTQLPKAVTGLKVSIINGAEQIDDVEQVDAADNAIAKN